MIFRANSFTWTPSHFKPNNLQDSLFIRFVKQGETQFNSIGKNHINGNFADKKSLPVTKCGSKN
jgi:hypothetical protein